MNDYRVREINSGFFSEDIVQTRYQLPYQRTNIDKVKQRRFAYPINELHTHEDEGHLEEDQVREHLGEHFGTVRDGFVEHLQTEWRVAIQKNVGRFITGSETEEVFEDLVQHKYAKLAQASYENYNGKSVEEFLNDPKNAYAGTAEFEVDNVLTTKDNLVLTNPKTGETHISFRGTQEAEALKDWIVNTRIALGGGQETGRFKDADLLMNKVIEKYGKDSITLSGHSQGGGLSSHFGAKYDVPSHSFDPAISLKQIQQHANGDYLFNGSKQTIYRVKGDVVSINSNHPVVGQNFEVKTINSTPELGNKLLNLHDLAIYHPEPSGVPIGTSVKVVRNTTLTSLKGATKAAIETGGVALAGVEWFSDMRKDLDDKNATNAVIDTTADVGGFFAADAAFTTASAATEGTLLAAGAVEGGALVAALPVAIGIAAAVGVGIGIEMGAEELKKTKFARDAGRRAKKTAKAWSKFEDQVSGVEGFQEKAKNADIYDTGRWAERKAKEAKSNIYEAGDSVKDGFNEVKDTAEQGYETVKSWFGW